MSAKTRLALAVAGIVALATLYFFIPGPRQEATPIVAAPLPSTAPEADIAPPPEPQANTAATAAKTPPEKETTASRPRIGPGIITGTATLPNNAPKTPITVEIHRVEMETQLISYDDTKIATTTAAPDGTFAFEKLPLAEHQIYAATATHVAQGVALLTRENPERNAVLTLAPGGTITGRVVDPNRDPVANANVFVAASDVAGQKRDAPRLRALSSRVLTDADGRFTMGFLRLSVKNEPGYRLAVKADGFAMLLSDYIKAGARDIELMLSEGAVVSGNLTKTGTTEPVPGETVLLESDLRFERLAGESDAEGFFFIPDVPAGTHLATLADSDYVIVPKSGVFEVPKGASSAEVALQVLAGGIVSGRVYNADTNEGLAGVQLGVQVGDDYDVYTTVTDADGAYRFTSLVPRPLEIHVGKPRGYLSPGKNPSSASLTPVSGQETRDIDFPLNRGMSISGLVVDEDGKPIAGASASASDGPGFYEDNLKTDERGAFTLTGFPRGTSVRLYVTKSGYAAPFESNQTRPSYTLNKDRSGIIITMLRGYKVSGIVVDAQGTAVNGVEVAAQTTSEPPRIISYSSSDAAGAVSLPDLPPGEYRVGVYQRTRRSIEDEQSAPKVTIAQSDITGLRFVAAGKKQFSISGRVVDSIGNPVPNANVTASSQGNTDTDASGAFTLSGLDEGPYRLWATSPNFAPSLPVSVEAGATGVVLTLTTFTRIQGQVVDAQSGLPVPIFTIKCNEEKTFRDVQGRFAMEAVRNTTTTLTATADGYAPVVIPLQPLAIGQTQRDVIVRLEPGITLSGRVNNREGQPIQGARIRLDPVNAQTPFDYHPSTYSAADGTFELGSLPNGTMKLSAYHADYAATTQPVTVAKGALNRVEVVLSAGASVSGVVTLNGKPYPDVSVYVGEWPNGGDREGKTDGQGRYHIDHLRPVEVRVHTSSNQPSLSRHTQKRVVLADRRTTEVNLELNAGTAAIEGTIFAEPGVPVRSRMSVSARWDNRSGGVYTRSDATGNFVIEGLPAGEVLLHVNLDNDFPRFATLQLNEGQRVRRDLVLSVGTTLHIDVSGVSTESIIQTRALLVPGRLHITTVTEETLNTVERAGSTAINGTRFKFPLLEAGPYTVLVWEFDKIASALGKNYVRRFIVAPVDMTTEPEQTLNLTF